MPQPRSVITSGFSLVGLLICLASMAELSVGTSKRKNSSTCRYLSERDGLTRPSESEIPTSIKNGSEESSSRAFCDRDRGSVHVRPSPQRPVPHLSW